MGTRGWTEAEQDSGKPRKEPGTACPLTMWWTEVQGTEVPQKPEHELGHGREWVLGDAGPQSTGSRGVGT